MERIIAEAKFQFHNGSIKRAGKLGELQEQQSFNSITVQLKVLGLKQSHNMDYSFNSITVQLKVQAFAMRLRQLVLFQFHNGSIKRSTCRK